MNLLFQKEVPPALDFFLKPILRLQDLSVFLFCNESNIQF